MVEWQVKTTYFLGNVLDVHSINMSGGFCKTTQTSGLYNCHLEKLIACLYDPSIKKERQK